MLLNKKWIIFKINDIEINLWLALSFIYWCQVSCRAIQRCVSLVSCVWQTKKKMGNRLYHWSRLVQTHDRLIARLLPNASRGSNGSEPGCFDPFCALIGWHLFDCWTRMNVRHGLQSQLFKLNHSSWSYYLQLYYKIKIFTIFIMERLIEK